MDIPFLDSNVILRHLLADDPDQSLRATSFLARVEGGDVEVQTADTVVFEVVCTLQRQYNQDKATIRSVMIPLIELPGILLPGKRRFRRVFDLYVDLNLPFADAYHAVLMEQAGTSLIATFDRHFDHIPGITRLDVH
jgi:predicted nucleic acid-binding protein